MRTAAIIAIGLVLVLAHAGEATDRSEELCARLAADPADPGALLAMAKHHEAAGRKTHARRYLRAFMRLVHRHPDRPAVARRLSTLRPEHPFVLERDQREDGGYLVYRNVIDRALAVRVPAGPYRRRLSFDDADVRVSITLPDYLIDLHEATAAAWQWFLVEGGYEVSDYWGPDGTAWLRDPDQQRIDWVFLGGRTFFPHHPQWGETFFEARARARWAGKRVPTEAEWEKAARGGVHLDGPDGRRKNPYPDRTYPWGDAPHIGPDGTYRAVLDAVIDLDDNRGEDGTVPVDTLPEGASPYGCRHMAGNVTEWNSDRWVDDAVRFGLPRVSPFASKPTDGKHDDTVRAVRGGYFNTGWRSARIDERRRRTFGSQGMCILFKAGLRCAADAPPLPGEKGPGPAGPLTDEPDPLDVGRLHVAAQIAEEKGDRARAYRLARAALRLVRHGVLRARFVDDVNRLRPRNPWKDIGRGRHLNVIDGKIAVRAGGVLADIHEVTEGDWMRFASEGGYEVREHWSEDGWRSRQWGIPMNIRRVGSGDRPATGISFHAAQAYARWARKRLPTIDEWRRLAGKSERRFPWGDEPPTDEIPRCACEETTEQEDERHLPDRRERVGSFPAGATPEGIHDLLGNVWEWVVGPEEPVLLGGDVWTSREDLESLEPRHEDAAGGTYSSEGDCGLRCVADRPEK
jgi:formylglycine-generating enzyme required for sulfatase activity